MDHGGVRFARTGSFDQRCAADLSIGRWFDRQPSNRCAPSTKSRPASGIEVIRARRDADRNARGSLPRRRGDRKHRDGLANIDGWGFSIRRPLARSARVGSSAGRAHLARRGQCHRHELAALGWSRRAAWRLHRVVAVASNVPVRRRLIRRFGVSRSVRGNGGCVFLCHRHRVRQRAARRFAGCSPFLALSNVVVRDR